MIGVPPPDGPAMGRQVGQRDDAGMALIVERFTRRGQVVCDPVLLYRRPAKLGSITVRFNDNFRRLDLVLESKKLQWQHFAGLPEPAAAFLRVRKETGDQRPVFRGMTADFQVG